MQPHPKYFCTGKIITKALDKALTSPNFLKHLAHIMLGDMRSKSVNDLNFCIFSMVYIILWRFIRL